MTYSAEIAPLRPPGAWDGPAPEPVPLSEATVGQGMVLVLGGLTMQLLDGISAVRGGTDPEVIHQTRVATRRLRSALSIFRRVSPGLTSFQADVQRCAMALGAVRDWDVFLAGVGATLVPVGDPRADALLRAASRRRDAAAVALASYLAGGDVRHLEHVLRDNASWDQPSPADPGPLAQPFPVFAAAVLSRRLKRTRRRGRSLDELPVDALHELRKDCKRLRYAAEFFAPAFPDQSPKRFLRRLADVQAQLGTLNDAVSCAELVAQLGRSGRGYAGGLATGLALAAAQPARVQVNRSWKRFRKAEPFWR